MMNSLGQDTPYISRNLTSLSPSLSISSIIIRSFVHGMIVLAMLSLSLAPMALNTFHMCEHFFVTLDNSESSQISAELA